MRRLMVFLCLIGLSACAGDLERSDALFHTSDDSGSLRLALTGSDAAGNVYRLRHATLEVSGTAMVTMSAQSAGRGEALYTPLPRGGYQVYLRPGFEVVAVQPDGSELPVTARLESANPTRVSVGARSDEQLALSFRVATTEIAFGAAPHAPMAQAP